MKSYNVGIVGLGTVGGGVYKQLKKKKSLIKKRTGLTVNVKSVCDKSAKALKALKVNKKQLVTDYKKLIADPDIHCVAELVGGIAFSKKLILEALNAGKDVVTANKALLAEEGAEIFEAAQANGCQIFYEASVGGGIPIIKGVKEALVSNKINTILCIINGTCNYILTEMDHEEMSFKDALKLAQEKGYAEADPTLDIEGVDSAHKIALLAELAFGKKFVFDDIPCEGITKIEDIDIAFASAFGYVIKLLAVAKQSSKGYELRVEPVLLPEDHILANVNDSYNAAYVMCDDAENLLFYGRGAGEHPTASAVVSDIVDLARVAAGEKSELPKRDLEPADIQKTSPIDSRYYLRFSVLDKPGTLSKLSDILGKNDVSISDMIQQERAVKKAVPLVVLTHETKEDNVRKALKEIKKTGVIKAEPQLMRIEEN